MEVAEAPLAEGQQETLELPRCLEQVAGVGDVVHHHLPAGGHRGRRRIHSHRPERDVEMVRPPIGEHAAAVVEPPVMIQPRAVERHVRRRPEPQVPVVSGRGFRIREAPGARPAVGVVPALHQPDLAQPPRAHDLDGLLVVRAGPLLRPHQGNDAVPAGRGDHRAPLQHRVRQRLLHVDVFPRLAGVDERQPVPVLGGGDEDRVHVLALQHATVIHHRLGLLRARAFRQQRLRLGHARLDHVADDRNVHIGVPGDDAHQAAPAASAPDEPDAYAVAGVQASGDGSKRSSCYKAAAIHSCHQASIVSLG